MNTDFISYKNFAKERDIYLCASGETLNKHTKKENGLYICVNAAALKIQSDFFFVHDYTGAVPTYIETVKPNIDSFFGINQYKKYSIPSEIIKKCQAKTYYPILSKNFELELNENIIEHVSDGHSVIFPAAQFALWCSPKRIFLVGCDCTHKRFDGSNAERIIPNLMIKNWTKIKEFQKAYYPNTEIISINPVGLKGIFKDIHE